MCTGGAEDTNLVIFQELKVSKALIDKDAIYSAEGGATVQLSANTTIRDNFIGISPSENTGVQEVTNSTFINSYTAIGSSDIELDPDISINVDYSTFENNTWTTNGMVGLNAVISNSLFFWIK